MEVMGGVSLVYENWTHIVSFAALVMSGVILFVTIHSHKKTIATSEKTIATSEKILEIAKQQYRTISYANMENIVKKSNKGYDVFPILCSIFDSYEGVWIDDGIKQFVNDKSKEMEEFDKEDPTPEQEQPYTDEEANRAIEETQQEDQKYFESLTPMEQYLHTHNERFGNMKNELLELIRKKSKEYHQKDK